MCLCSGWFSSVSDKMWKKKTLQYVTSITVDNVIVQKYAVQLYTRYAVDKYMNTVKLNNKMVHNRKHCV
jgi:hypothetical protein